jgi:hypothetical protein
VKKLFLFLTLVLFAHTCSAELLYEQTYSVAKDLGTSQPFSVQNAWIQSYPGPVEYGGTLSYWRPTTPNVWAEIVYKFEIPFTIQNHTNIDTKILSYNGHDLNPAFDPGGKAYLDVSTDNANWTTLVTIASTVLSDANLDHYDISPLVQSANTVYIRARLLETIEYGSFTATQFMRCFDDGTYMPPHSSHLALRVESMPEPSSIITLLIASIIIVVGTTHTLHKKLS